MCSPVPIKMMGLRVAATLRGNKNFMALKGPTPTSTDRKMKLVLRAQSSSSFGVSVQFGDDYRSYIYLVFKSFGLRLTGLTNGCIHHIHNVVWLLETGSEGHRWVTHQQLRINKHKNVTVSSHKRKRCSQVLTTALETCSISSNSESSCLCRPLVSTMMISKFSVLNLSTPSVAITTGSISV